MEKARQYDYNIFISVFPLPNTLQVSQAKEDVRSYNVGQSDYSKHKIQPWDIWLEYNLNPWDADIIKRVLRTKETDSRKLDYEKIIHVTQKDWTSSPEPYAHIYIDDAALGVPLKHSYISDRPYVDWDIVRYYLH